MAVFGQYIEKKTQNQNLNYENVIEIARQFSMGTLMQI